jgi:hypothetical protein
MPRRPCPGRPSQLRCLSFKTFSTFYLRRVSHHDIEAYGSLLSKGMHDDRGRRHGPRMRGQALWAAEPLVETDAAEARVAQRHERVLLDPAAPVSGRGIAYDLTRVADRLQIAGDDFVEQCSFRAGDLDETVSGRIKRRIGNYGSNVVSRDGGASLTMFPSALEAAMPPRNSRN